jgi:uncharacterized membrane protein YfcA
MLDQHWRLIYSAVLGVMSGFLSGLLGLTGSVFIIPFILMLGIFNTYKSALGTILFSFDPILSSFALIQYAKKKQIDYLVGVIIMASYMLGVYMGFKAGKFANEKTLTYLNAIILLFLSLYMFYKAKMA